jgi:hypothetical protein
MTSAALRLRGRDGPIRADIRWPDCVPEAVVVIIGDDTATPPDTSQAVTLRVQCATPQDERIAIEWTEDHARELGVPHGRVIVVRPR